MRGGEPTCYVSACEEAAEKLPMPRCLENQMTYLRKGSQQQQFCFHDLAENARAKEALCFPPGRRPRCRA